MTRKPKTKAKVKSRGRRIIAKRRPAPLRSGLVLYLNGNPDCARHLERGQQRRMWEVKDNSDAVRYHDLSSDDVRRLLREGFYTRKPRA